MYYNKILGLTACISTVGLASVFAQDSTASSPQKPNIILIVADDMDYAGIGITGGKDTKTPNIDSIGQNGVSFTQAYVSIPVCGPSRVAMLTGQYQDRIGYLTNDGPDVPETFGLPSSVVLIPEMLDKAGYTSGMVGKWHLGFKPDMVPNAQGFDYFFGHLHAAHDYNPGVAKPGPILKNDKPVKTTKYLTTVFGDEAADFVRRNADNPYFLYVPFNAVHAPWQAPAETEKLFSHIEDKMDRTIAAMLYEMDQAVGDILQAVKENGDEENTLIVFTNDNGGIRGELPYTNAGLRGGKMDLYEGGIRVPLLMQWKGKIQAGQKYNQMASTLDLVPTFLAAAGTTTTETIDGVNLLPYISGKNTGSPHETLYWRFIDAPTEYAIRKGDWKAVKPAPTRPWELYNIADDEKETRNLATEKPELLKDLKVEWAEWNMNNEEPMFMDMRIFTRRQQMREQKEKQQGGAKANSPHTTPTKQQRRSSRTESQERH